MTVAVVPFVVALVFAGVYLGVPDAPPRWRSSVRSLALYGWAAAVLVVLLQVGGQVWRP